MTTDLNKEIELQEDTQKGKFLTFNLGDEVYGIGIDMVTEIIGILPITKVPEQPDHIMGVVNLRGKIISVLDMRLRFKKPFLDYNERTCIVVVSLQDLSIGLIVDCVAEVINIAEENIVDLPPTRTGFSNNYIKNIGKVGDDVKLLLDCEKIIIGNVPDNIDEIEQLAV